MRALSRPLTVLTALVLLGGPLTVPARAVEAPPDLKKLHVLLVFDTHSNLGPGLIVDQEHVHALLKAHIPDGMYKETVFTGGKVTKQNVLNYYKNLKLGPDEGVFLFYGGHGATLKNQHCLTFDSARATGDYLTRDELRKAMKDTKAGLVVLLTDCCSNRPKVRPKIGAPDVKGPDDLPTPAVRGLFFKTRGVVDITAATLEKAYGDDEKGGLFTRSLWETLDTNPPREALVKYDTNKDGLLTWPEYFPYMQKHTIDLFKKWQNDPDVQRGEPGIKTVQPQTPRKYSLGEPLNVAGGTTTPKKGEFFVVSLANKTTKNVSFEYRWTGEKEWKKAMLKPGGETFFFHPATSKDSEPVVLETRIVGKETVSPLAPKTWSGSGKPTFKDGLLYNFNPRKTASAQK